MPKVDTAAIAVNAAGITDALASIECDNGEAAARFERTIERYEGRVGIMQQVAEAAETMEWVRVKHGVNARWGGELPYLYDVWDAIAQGLWDHLGAEPVDAIVHRSIEQVVSAEAV